MGSACTQVSRTDSNYRITKDGLSTYLDDDESGSPILKSELHTTR